MTHEQTINETCNIGVEIHNLNLRKITVVILSRDRITTPLR